MFARRAWEKVVNFEFLICFILNKFYWQNVYRAPHPSPVAFAGRHLPPKGKASVTATQQKTKLEGNGDPRILENGSGLNF